MRNLIIVSDLFEAEQAVEIKKRNGESAVLALTLEAEFYLQSVLSDWQNPLYDFIDDKIDYSKKYVFPDFKIAHTWADGSSWEFIADRFGYFLSEFDKSYDFAKRAIAVVKPQKIMVGQFFDFPGASVLYGTLKTDAFYLAASEKNIRVEFLERRRLRKISARQLVGSFLQKVRFGNQKIGRDGCDVLLLVTARQLMGIQDFVWNLGKAVNLQILTWNMTFAYRRKIDKFGFAYLEKERLMDSTVRSEVEISCKRLIAKHDWASFVHPQYATNTRVNKFFQNKLKRIAYEEMSEVIADIIISQKVLSIINPRMLVTTTDPDTKVLPYIKLAKRLKIETVCIQHGAFYGFDSPAIYPQSDFFITWSDLTKRSLVKVSHFKKLSIVVGQSPFHKFRKFKKNSFSRRVKILYLTSVHLVDQGQVILNLKRLLRLLESKSSKFALLVRTHPNQVQHITNLAALLSDSKIEGTFVNDAELSQVLEACDLVIFENTTAGFDAMLAGKPTIYFNPYSGEDFFGVKKHDSTLAILSGEDFKKLEWFLENRELWLLNAKRGYDYALKYLGTIKSNSNRIVGAILKILTTA